MVPEAGHTDSKHAFLLGMPEAPRQQRAPESLLPSSGGGLPGSYWKRGPEAFLMFAQESGANCELSRDLY